MDAMDYYSIFYKNKRLNWNLDLFFKVRFKIRRLVSIVIHFDFDCFLIIHCLIYIRLATLLSLLFEFPFLPH